MRFFPFLERYHRDKNEKNHFKKFFERIPIILREHKQNPNKKNINYITVKRNTHTAFVIIKSSMFDKMPIRVE